VDLEKKEVSLSESSGEKGIKRRRERGRGREDSEGVEE